jgi:hypothetical protein
MISAIDDEVEACALIVRFGAFPRVMFDVDVG